MIFKPVNNYVSLEIISPEEGDIVMSENSRQECRWAKVLDVGPGLTNLVGELEKSQLNVGDLVYVMAHGRELVDLSNYNGDTTHVASELDIMCKIEDINTMTIKPLGCYIEVEKEEIEEEDSSILIAQTKKVPTHVGLVKSIGVGWKDIGGNPIEFQVKVGDRVVFDPYNPGVVDMTPLGIEGKRFLIMHTDIYGVVIK